MKKLSHLFWKRSDARHKMKYCVIIADNHKKTGRSGSNGEQRCVS